MPQSGHSSADFLVGVACDDQSGPALVIERVLDRVHPDHLVLPLPGSFGAVALVRGGGATMLALGLRRITSRQS